MNLLPYLWGLDRLKGRSVIYKSAFSFIITFNGIREIFEKKSSFFSVFKDISGNKKIIRITSSAMIIFK